MKTYKVEDIFQDIKGDDENVLMTIPEEILEAKGWGEGTIVKIEIGDRGSLIITEVDPNDSNQNT